VCITCFTPLILLELITLIITGIKMVKGCVTNYIINFVDGRRTVVVYI